MLRQDLTNVTAKEGEGELGKFLHSSDGYPQDGERVFASQNLT